MTSKAKIGAEIFRWSLDQYHQLAEANVLPEEARTELLNGEIIYMSPIGKLHAACVRRIDKLLQKLLGDRVLISTQNPISIALNDSEPQPDIAVLQPRADFYAAKHPAPEDVHLIIEIADSSVEKDRTLKIPLYAQANIPECWLVNLNEQSVEVYTEPDFKGYRNIRICREGDYIDSIFLGKIEVNKVIF